MQVFDEVELRLQTEEMYRVGGVDNVLACVKEMMRCERVILEKLHEILLEEHKRAE